MLAGTSCAITFLVLTLLPAAAQAQAPPTLFRAPDDSLVSIGPPYPTDAHEIQVAQRVGDGVRINGVLSVGLGQALNDASAQLSIGLSVENGPPWLHGFGGLVSFEAACCDEDDCQCAGALSISISIDIAGASGPVAKLICVQPGVPLGDDGRFFQVTEGADSLRLVFLAELAPAIRHELTLAAALPEGIEIGGWSTVLADRPVSVVGKAGRRPSGVPRRVEDFFTETVDASFDIELTLDLIGDVDVSEALITLELHGETVADPCPIARASWSVLKSVFRE
jgi:hypothetical protein